MSTIKEQDKKKERNKLARMAAAGAGTAGLFVVGWPVVGAIGLVGTGYLAVDWFMFRAKRGMRF
jgi:hypothetical protein